MLCSNQLDLQRKVDAGCQMASRHPQIDDLNAAIFLYFLRLYLPRSYLVLEVVADSVYIRQSL